MANTIWNPSDKTANITVSGGNLVATSTSSAQGGIRAADKQINGKFYWEITATTFTSNSSSIGIATPWADLTTVVSTGLGKCCLTRNGILSIDGVSAVSGFGTIASGTVVCFAFDATNRLIWVRVGAAGNWNNNAANNPATGIGGAATNSLGNGIPAFPAFLSGVVSEAATANFGDTAFAGAVPAGFTSGFTAGATSSTNALATQAALEQFIISDPPSQITQVALEQWTSAAVGNSQALITQIGLEQWVQEAFVPPVIIVRPRRVQNVNYR